MSRIKLFDSDLSGARGLINRHLDALAFPLESWVEDNVFKAQISLIEHKGKLIGYAATKNTFLETFHVLQEHYRYAPAAFSRVTEAKKIERVRMMTHDYFLAALLAEWDYDKVKGACFFIDTANPENLKNEAFDEGFRIALPADLEAIRSVSGAFFDESGGGFNTLEERVAAETIFVIEDGPELLGCGILEEGRLCPGFASIGMFTNPDHRNRGVAKKVLVNLKKHVYRLGLSPLAGCWYYNTLSRRSLEAAGMVAVSIGYEAILKGKEEVPLQTALPPHEPE